MAAENITKHDSVIGWIVSKSDFYSQFSYDRDKKEIWWTYVYPISFGEEGERVYLAGMGTKKTGLFHLTYVIFPSGTSCYDRALSLVAELESKYGAFRKQGEGINFAAGIALFDNTIILVSILNKEALIIE